MKKRIVLKIVSLILILTIAVPSVAFAAEDSEAWKIHGEFGKHSTFRGMSAWYGDGTVQPVVSDDPTGWTLQFKGTQHIYVDIKDSLMYNLRGETVEIEVDYYDAGLGVFTLQYDGFERTDDEAEYVDLKDSNSWKTHTFFIQDPRFKNGLDDADFRITVSSTFLSYGNKTYGVRDDVIVGAVRVKKADVISPIQMKLTTEATGNIFFEDEKIKVDVEYTNKLKEEYKLNAHIEAVDTENRILWEDSHEISFGKEEVISKTYEFDIDRFGMNWLRVTLTDDEGKIFCIRDAEFFYVTTNHGTRLNYDLGTTTHGEQPLKYGDYKKILPLLVNAGYGRERMDITWGRMTAGYSGLYLNDQYQNMLDAYKAAGVKITVIVACATSHMPYVSSAVYDRGAPTPQFEKDYADYVRFLVEKTKDYADAYIIGNEQDHTSYPAEKRLPSSYAKWCQIAYEVIKEEYPEADVIGYGLTTGDRAWFEESIALGTHNYFDYPDFHLYSAFKTYEGQDFLGRLKTYYDSAKNKYGAELAPAQIGETGYFHLRHGNLSPFEISHQFPKLYIYSEASDLVNNIIDYSMCSAGPESYGHIRGADAEGKRGFDLPYAPHREYLTIACWNKNFGGDSDFVSSIDGENTRLYKFKRRSDGKDFAALWAVKGIENVTLDLGTNEITYMDILGNEEQMYSDDGRYTFNLSEDIKYIIGNFARFELCDTPKFDFGVEQLGVVEGVTKEVSVTVDGAKPEGYTISTTDFMKAKTAFVGKENDALCLGITTQSPENDYTAKYLAGETGRSQFTIFGVDHIRDVVSVDIMKDGKLYSRCEIPLVEIQPASMKATVLPKSIEEVNNWQATISVTNEIDTELIGKLVVSEPTAASADISLAPGETYDIAIAVPANLVGQEVTLKAQLTLDSGEIIEYMDRKDTCCAVYTDTPPTIDGNISADEWVLDAYGKISKDTYTSLIKTEMYTGDDDLSGTVNMMWDKDNLYLAIPVKDNEHRQANKDGGTWKADGLQIGFTAGENPTDMTQLRLALGDDGNVYKYLSTSEDGSNAKGVISDEDMTMAVKREDGLTTYEMRISWKLIMPLTNAIQVNDGGKINEIVIVDDVRKEAKNGESFRLGVLVNDDDGKGRKGFIEYGTGISGGTFKGFKNILLFGGE